jgi:hypothetical protein
MGVAAGFAAAPFVVGGDTQAPHGREIKLLTPRPELARTFLRGSPFFPLVPHIEICKIGK